MIVEADFMDHWKTRMLGDLLGNQELVPGIMLRLWGHCQTRKKAAFHDMTPAILKSVCRFAGEGQALWDALVAARFVEIEGGCFVVHQWEDTNAGLVKNWKNGQAGGRPRKPSNNPTITQTKPNDNPEPTHGNPTVTDRVDRVDRVDPPYPPEGGKGSEAEARSPDSKELRRGRAPKASASVFVLNSKLKVVETEIKRLVAIQKKRGALDEDEAKTLRAVKEQKQTIEQQLLKA